jgi:hypothetical protein
MPDGVHGGLIGAVAVDHDHEHLLQLLVSAMDLRVASRLLTWFTRRAGRVCTSERGLLDLGRVEDVQLPPVGLSRA